MLKLLLVKDLKRTRANPWLVVLWLALPLCITALIGLTFGSASQGQGLGRIKIAIVDEDDSALGDFIRSGMTQGEAKERIDVRFIARAETETQIQDEGVSAVLIIPQGFTEGYLAATNVPHLELVKNPAQTFYPAIVQELLNVVVEGLNAVVRNLREELPVLRSLLEEEGRPDMLGLANLMIKVGNKFESAEDYLFPPLVTYAKELRDKEGAEDEGSDFNLFAFLLPGLVSMFLLYLADGMARDLYAELAKRTFDRYRTLRSDIWPFILSKILLGVVVVAAGGLILFVGGGLIFRFGWDRPLETGVVLMSYCFFAAAFTILLASLARSEMRANVIGNVVILAICFLGGSFFQAGGLPPFIRDTITPWMPNYWFIEAVRGLQFNANTLGWVEASVRLGALAALLAGLSAYWCNRMLRKGLAA